MPDGHYRDALDRIEQQLCAEDPAFAARMRALAAAPRPLPTISLLSAGLFISMPLVALLFGPAAAIRLAGVTTAVIAAILIRRRRPRRLPTGSRP